MNVEEALARASIRASIHNCSRCHLGPATRARSSRPVPFSGPSPARICVVGEAPGREEDKANEPFVGPAGAWFRQRLVEVGLKPETLFWCNTVSCWPVPHVTPTNVEVRACHPNLAAQIVASEAPLLLVVGQVALRALWPGKKAELKSMHGKVWALGAGPGIGRSMFVTYHPAAALRNAFAYQNTIVADLVDFAAIAKTWHQP